MSKQYKQVIQFSWSHKEKLEYNQLNDFLEKMTGAILDIQYTHNSYGSNVLVTYIHQG